MTEPITTTSAALAAPAAGGALGALLVSQFGVTGGEVALIAMMSIAGTSAGHAMSPEKSSVWRYALTLFGAIVGASFVSAYLPVSPALGGGLLGFILIAPKQNLDSVFTLIDRIRGIK